MDEMITLSESGSAVFTRALEEARRLNHCYIGTEHLLLALTGERAEIATQVLYSMGVRLAKVRSAVDFIIGRGDEAIVGPIGFTPRVRTVIEMAREEARGLGATQVCPEHILIAIVDEGKGIAVGVLESLGGDLDRLRSDTLAALRENDRLQLRDYVGWIVKEPDKACPPDYPIRGTGGPKVFFAIGTDVEEITHPDICFQTEHDAWWEGYRKVSSPFGT